MYDLEPPLARGPGLPQLSRGRGRVPRRVERNREPQDQTGQKRLQAGQGHPPPQGSHTARPAGDTWRAGTVEGRRRHALTVYTPRRGRRGGEGNRKRSRESRPRHLYRFRRSSDLVAPARGTGPPVGYSAKPLGGRSPSLPLVDLRGPRPRTGGGGREDSHPSKFDNI